MHHAISRGYRHYVSRSKHAHIHIVRRGFLDKTIQRVKRGSSKSLRPGQNDCATRAVWQSHASAAAFSTKRIVRARAERAIDESRRLVEQRQAHANQIEHLVERAGENLTEFIEVTEATTGIIAPGAFPPILSTHGKNSVIFEY